MKKVSGIYCIENLVNGKRYIGQGVDVHKRMNKKHYGSYALNNAVEKYREENFKKYVICYCEVFELDRLERESIKKLKSHCSEWGYNISFGGDTSMRGRNHSCEAKKKMSDNHADFSGEKHPSFGKRLSDETRKKIKEGLFGKKRKNASSKYFGVCKTITGEKYTYWMARAKVNEKTIYIGSFKTEIEAALAYDKYITENKYPNSLNFP